MLSAVLEAPRNIQIREFENPTPRGDDVIVRIRACGICPTDVRKYTGASKVQLPLVLGHEAAGDVAEVGPEVRSIKVGDRVIVMPSWSCGRCGACRIGDFIHCEQLTSIGGAAEHSRMVAGAFSELVRVPERAIVSLEGDLDYEEAIFADPLTSTLNDIERCQIRLGDDVVIVGAGPMGLLHLMLAKLRGARVIVSDPIAERRERALAMGAAETIDSQAEDPVAAVQRLTRGSGAAAVIVAVGNPKAEEMAMGMAGPGGRISFFAGTWPPTTIAVDPNELHYTQRILTGAFGGSVEQFLRTVKLLESRLVDVRPLITHRLSLNQLQEGFEMTLQGEGLKKVVVP